TWSCRTRSASAAPTALSSSGGSDRTPVPTGPLRDIDPVALLARVGRTGVDPGASPQLHRNAGPGAIPARDRGRSVVLTSRPLPPDTDFLALHRQDPSRFPLLLQSVAHGTAQARWDLLLVAEGGSLALDLDGITRAGDGAVLRGPFLQALDAEWTAARLPREEPRWPFRGGWALLLGFELAGLVEPVLR